MKRVTFTIILFFLFVSGCVSEYGKSFERSTPVKLSDLLQDPTRWKGRFIEVEGVFNWELEGDAIFQTKEDLQKKSRKKAISLIFDNPALKIPYGEHDKSSIWRKTIVPLSLRLHRGKQAVVAGVFESESFGDLYAGSMTVSQLSLK